ncbi:hypothetical protein JHK87_029645 [Glycine soja]|nr:hypothetical protein JHK87_029645 [Glycine soja]
MHSHRVLNGELHQQFTVLESHTVRVVWCLHLHHQSNIIYIFKIKEFSLNTIKKILKRKGETFSSYYSEGKCVLFGGQFSSTRLTGNMSAVVAGSSSSFSATFTTRSSPSLKNSQLSHSKTLTSPQCQAVDGGGNAARAGLKAGDQVLYTSSFFGDELWPADKLGFTKTAIQAKPDSVYFVVSRLKMILCPFYNQLLIKCTSMQARATHICLDCGYIYTLQKSFDEQPDTYGCPQCQAPKKRFARYDVNTGKAIGGGLPPIGVIIGLLAGVGAVGALLVYGLQ